MNEEWARSKDNGRAVRTGQAGTARVITAAATIMICVFVAFSLMGQLAVAEFWRRPCGRGRTGCVSYFERSWCRPSCTYSATPTGHCLAGSTGGSPHLAIEPRKETPVIRPDGTANPDPMALMAL